MTKIAFLTPLQFITAIAVGIIVAVAIASLTVPHPVEQKVIVITPVPTPAPVYVQPTAQPIQPTTQTQPIHEIPEDTMGILAILPIAIVGVGIMTIIIGAFAGSRY
jgi:hypothetical protein